MPSSARDRRMKEWGSALAPDEKDLEPLPFERPNVRKEIVERAQAGLAYFESLGVSGATLEKLVRAIRLERTATARERNWPSLSEDKARLRQVLRYANALMSELESMSMRVEIALNSGYHESNEAREEEARAKGEHFDSDAIDHVRLHEEQLPVLIFSATRALEHMPYQARPPSQVHLIDVVAKALQPLGIKPSKSVTSKFHRACEAAFCIANVEVQLAGKSRPRRPSPTGSIRAYLAKRGRYSRFLWD